MNRNRVEVAASCSSGQNSSHGGKVLKVNFDYVIGAAAGVPPHLQTYEDVNSHPSDHLLVSGYTSLFQETKDPETKPSQDREPPFAGVTPSPLSRQPNPSCPNERSFKQGHAAVC